MHECGLSLAQAGPGGRAQVTPKELTVWGSKKEQSQALALSSPGEAGTGGHWELGCQVEGTTDESCSLTGVSPAGSKLSWTRTSKPWVIFSKGQCGS